MNKILPEDFDWKFYLEYYEDLRYSGLKTEQDAKIHYLNYGQYENRIHNNTYPITIFDDITFIHIPKSGGTTIENFLLKNNFSKKIYNGVYINGHTPQHCTYRELEELNLLTDKIFTIVRPEIDRVVSEYFYILEKRSDLSKLFKSFDEFLELFLSYDNSVLFDNHNLSNKDFLINKNGEIDKKIKIFDFFDYQAIENYLGLKGLSNIHENKSNKNYSILKKEHVIKINQFYVENS